MDTRIETALATIERHLDAVSIAKLAASVNLSASRFAHLFQREVGTSPARYVRALRMLRARALLEQTFLSVKQVMARVGCNDQSHFSRDFRRVHGVTPRSCRRHLATGQKRFHSLKATASFRDVASLANERLKTPPEPLSRARAPDDRRSSPEIARESKPLLSGDGLERAQQPLSSRGPRSFSAAPSVRRTIYSSDCSHDSAAS
jgi:AraC-like DNA-binding protein